MGPSTLKLSLLFIFLLGSAALANPNIPNSPILKIKTRRNGPFDSTVETLYFKGSKRRREYSRDTPSKMGIVSISRCDERKRIELNEEAKLYAELPIIDWSEQRKRARTLPPTEMTGAEVTITIDSIDTGERRAQGAYTARHLKIRTTVESGPGAAMPSSTGRTRRMVHRLARPRLRRFRPAKRLRLRDVDCRGTAQSHTFQTTGHCACRLSFGRDHHEDGTRQENRQQG